MYTQVFFPTCQALLFLSTQFLSVFMLIDVQIAKTCQKDPVKIPPLLLHPLLLYKTCT